MFDKARKQKTCAKRTKLKTDELGCSLMVSSSCSTIGTVRGTGTSITNSMIIHNYSHATVKMRSILSIIYYFITENSIT